MGRHIFEIDRVISKGMIRVIRKRDILSARTLSREEKKGIERGGADIMATTPSGQTIMLRRADVIRNYTYLNGKKISLAGWSSSKSYIIARRDNSEALAMLVPLNCSVEVNGKVANKTKKKTGDYVVALLDSNGNIDESTIGIVTAPIFKKMYSIPQNEIIERNKSLNGGNREYIIGGKKSKRKHGGKRGEFKGADYVSQLDMDASSIDFGVEDIYNQPSIEPKKTKMNLSKEPINSAKSNGQLGMQTGMQGSVQSSQGSVQGSQGANYKYFATGRLMSPSGELVGFIIQNKTGQTKKITKAQMMDLCSKRLVANIMVGIKSDTGTKYLRGNNIRIESLPAYIEQR